MKNPFPVSGYFGPSTFCDRIQELTWIENQMQGGVPAVIIGIRRLGKTGLIKHYFRKLDKTGKEKGIFIDLQGTTTLNGLIEKLAVGISTAFPEKNHQKLWNAILSFRPNISFDPLTGSPQIGFDFKTTTEAKKGLGSLLALLSKQKIDVVLAFDEFQEIANYTDLNMEGIIRSEMQSFPSLRYLFSGSKTHLLNQMFQEGSRPFFGGVQKLYLAKLNNEIYSKFILKKFERAEMKIDVRQVEDILNWTQTHTYYTQYICNQIFVETKDRLSAKHLDQIKWRILQVSKQDFFQLRDIISKGQWRLLVAIAKEEHLYQPTSTRIMDKYKLNTPRAIIKALSTLLDKQLIYQEFNDHGEKYYNLSDVFLMRFIQNYI